MAQFIWFPVTQAEVMRNFDAFSAIAGFSRVVGVLDATHVRLKNAPGGERPQNYINSSGWHSVLVQVSAAAIFDFGLDIFDVFSAAHIYMPGCEQEWLI